MNFALLCRAEKSFFSGFGRSDRMIVADFAERYALIVIIYIARVQNRDIIQN